MEGRMEGWTDGEKSSVLPLKGQHTATPPALRRPLPSHSPGGSAVGDMGTGTRDRGQPCIQGRQALGTPQGRCSGSMWKGIGGLVRVRIQGTPGWGRGTCGLVALTRSQVKPMLQEPRREHRAACSQAWSGTQTRGSRPGWEGQAQLGPSRWGMWGQAGLVVSPAGGQPPGMFLVIVIACV